VNPCEHGSLEYYPHPSKAKFIHCAHNTRFIKDCGPGTVWRQSKKWCDHPNYVDLFFEIIGALDFELDFEQPELPVTDSPGQTKVGTDGPNQTTFATDAPTDGKGFF
jgi:hypothetical protein